MTGTFTFYHFTDDGTEICCVIASGKVLFQEMLSDGGSPDSSGADRYSTHSEEESDPLTLNKNLLNVDIFLNKPSG